MLRGSCRGGRLGGFPGLSVPTPGLSVPPQRGQAPGGVPRTQSPRLKDRAVQKRGFSLSGRGSGGVSHQALGLASSSSDKMTQKKAALPEIPLAVPWQQPPDKVSSPAGGGWPLARWDPASTDARGEQLGNALTPTRGRWSLPEQVTLSLIFQQKWP